MDNMEAIKAAIQQLKIGTGSFEQLKAEVMKHDFTTIDTKVRSVQELAERWEYAPVAGKPCQDEPGADIEAAMQVLSERWQQ